MCSISCKFASKLRSKVPGWGSKDGPMLITRSRTCCASTDWWARHCRLFHKCRLESSLTVLKSGFDAMAAIRFDTILNRLSVVNSSVCPSKKYSYIWSRISEVRSWRLEQYLLFSRAEGGWMEETEWSLVHLSPGLEAQPHRFATQAGMPLLRNQWTFKWD